MAASIASRQPLRPASEHQRALDEWQRGLYRACGMAIGRWLEERGGLNQPISALRLHELEGMAWAVIGEYSDRREARRKELGLAFNADPIKPDPLDTALSV